MVIPITACRARTGGQPRPFSVLETRRRALERLYRRKVQVENLIRSLELYQEVQRAKRRQCLNGGSDWRR